MTVRLDLKEGVKADLHTWFYEAADKVYKTLPRYYNKMAEILSVNEIKGGYWKGTSALGALELESRENGGQLKEDRPIEGYTVYAKVQDRALKVKCPRELKRDWHKTQDWLRDYVKKNWPAAVETTKEKIIARLFNKGGYTSGDSEAFNNNDGDLSLTTYSSPNLVYDGKPFLNRDGNDRTAKYQATGTYYNATAITTGDDSAGVTFDNAKDMWNLLTATNNVMDNGKKFDNSFGVSILCHPSLKLAWEQVNNSTLNPDNTENASNPLKGAFRSIIANPYLDTTTFSCMFREGMGIKYWLSEPKFDFWEDNDPPTFWASVILDFAICVQNWRPFVANNAPTS